MGVYIKGMEMPKKYPVTITIFPDGVSVVKTISGRRFTATAVPVPPHGRLIDVKSLENMHFTECMYDAESKLFVPLVEVASAIFDAPTIIPAEEGE